MRKRPETAQSPTTMSQVVIENPIIDSSFTDPTRHFRFSDEALKVFQA
jgi:hypothetical protein